MSSRNCFLEKGLTLTAFLALAFDEDFFRFRFGLFVGLGAGSDSTFGFGLENVKQSDQRLESYGHGLYCITPKTGKAGLGAPWGLECWRPGSPYGSTQQPVTTGKVHPAINTSPPCLGREPRGCSMCNLEPR